MPIYCISNKEGIMKVFEGSKEEFDQNKAKEAITIFKKVWYDEKSDSSLLECYPITGRTH